MSAEQAGHPDELKAEISKGKRADVEAYLAWLLSAPPAAGDDPVNE